MLGHSLYFTSSSRICQNTWSSTKSNPVVIIVPKVGINVRKRDISSSLIRDYRTMKSEPIIWAKDIPTVPHGSMRFHWHGVMWFESIYWYKLYAQSAPIISWNFQQENNPSLIVEQMLVTCNETIQNDQEVKSDFLHVVDYHDKQKLGRVSVEPSPSLV